MENLENKWEEYDRVLKSSHAIEIRISDVVEAAELADQFVASHAPSNTGFCKSSQESAFAEILKKVEKACAAMVVIVGTDPENSTEDWISFIRYCAKQLPVTTAVIAVHTREELVSGRRSFHHVQGFEFDSIQEHRSQEIFSSRMTQISDDDSFDSIISSRFESFSSSSSFLTKDLTQDMEDSEVCSRSTTTGKSQFSLSPNNIECPVKGLIACSGDNNPESFLLKTSSAGYRVFSYDELKIATSQFSTESLIGEGGCSSVYKGFVGRKGKAVAIKVLKSYKEAWNDFNLETEIVSSLKHKHITSLIGVCCEDSHIISVYDFLPKGSLHEHLHGSRNKGVLPWDARFKMAVAVAEALNYLHTNECSVPVIHRDVKSSNILLTHKLQAQLSDFGLAMWGPTNSTYLSHTDVVGTFGYMAPEYFMHGKVSDKIDVYSYGVVLLELLSGKSPVDNEVKLVKWAKALMDSRMYIALMDPKLGGKFDTTQMHRMVRAATLCISQSARLRPTMIQILQLLNGKNNTDEWVKESGDQNDSDETYPEFSSDSHLNLALLELDDYTTPARSRKPIYHVKLKDYLREPQD